MTIPIALALIRETYMDEIQGVTDGPARERYREAVERYPVIMATALAIRAADFVKEGKRG